MEYTILESEDPDRLISTINTALQEGWRCQGGVAVYTYRDLQSRIDDTVWYAQAMVRDRQEKAE